MARSPEAPTSAGLLRAHDLYDRSVDILAAFDALFTRQEDMSARVTHFCRFPKLNHDDGRIATPDFTAIFDGKHGVVAEIANIALRDASVDKLCSQIGRYDTLKQLPSAEDGSLTTVEYIDILLFVPADLSNEAVDRVIGDRAMNSDSPYAPHRLPTVIGVSRDQEKYSFTRNRDSRNGELSVDILQGFLNKHYTAPGDFWSPVKFEKPFMNDPVDRLYLACLLWTRVLPSLRPGSVAYEIGTAEIREFVSTNYGAGASTKDIKAAFELLALGGFAKATNSTCTQWSVQRKSPRIKDGDFRQQLADRASNARPSAAGDLGVPVRRRGRADTVIEGQGVLPIALPPP